LKTAIIDDINIDILVPLVGALVVKLAVVVILLLVVEVGPVVRSC
jgi:hypothetical protein